MKNSAKSKTPLIVRLNRPYIRETLTLRTEFHSGVQDGKTPVTVTASGSIDLRILPLLLSMLAATLACLIAFKIKYKKR